MRNEKQTVLDMLIQPRNGDHFDRRQTEKELLEALSLKNEEISVLHQVNSRLAHELAQLQKRLGIDASSILQELERLGENHLKYPDLQPAYLSELLLAYDDTILKQKKVIAMLFSQLQDAERRAQTIVRDNEYLLDENKNKCAKILEIYQRGNPEHNLVSAYARLHHQMQQERSSLLREQNDHLLTAHRQLEQHAQKLQEQLEEVTSAADSHFSTLKAQSGQLQEALVSVDNLLKVKEFLEKTVARLGEENTTYETQKAENEAKIGKLETEVKSLRNQLFSFKRTSREQGERLTNQAESLRSQTEAAIKRQRQGFNRIMILEKQLETTKDNARTYRREAEKSKADLEQTLKMCEAYEGKIASLTRRQEAVRVSIDQNKEKLEQALLTRDKAQLKVEQLERTLENMSQRQREEVSRVRANYEKMLWEQQEKGRALADDKAQGESLFMETELQLKNQIEKLKRQNSLLQEENLKFIENIHVNTGSQIITQLKDYQTKNDSLLRLVTTKERQLKDLQSRSEDRAHQQESELRNLTRLLEKERVQSSQHLKQLTQERSRLSIALNEKQCLENELKRLRKGQQQQQGMMVEQREQKVQQLEVKLTEAVRKEKETRLRAIEMLEKYDEAQERLKQEYQKRLVEVEGENERLRRKLAKLKQ